LWDSLCNSNGDSDFMIKMTKEEALEILERQIKRDALARLYSKARVDATREIAKNHPEEFKNILKLSQERTRREYGHSYLVYGVNKRLSDLSLLSSKELITKAENLIKEQTFYESTRNKRRD